MRCCLMSDCEPCSLELAHTHDMLLTAYSTGCLTKGGKWFCSSDVCCQSLLIGLLESALLFVWEGTLTGPAVAAVGQFRDLVESSAKDVPLQETLRKVLNFTSKGWEAAKVHALRAVETDNRMRIWLGDDSLTQGLLFRCNLGRVDLESPVGEPPCPAAWHPISAGKGAGGPGNNRLIGLLPVSNEPLRRRDPVWEGQPERRPAGRDGGPAGAAPGVRPAGGKLAAAAGAGVLVAAGPSRLVHLARGLGAVHPWRRGGRGRDPGSGADHRPSAGHPACLLRAE